MTTFTNLCLFLIILFLYIHIIHQLKKSEDLEIYEMDYTTNIHLQEVCDIKQPVLFEYQSISPDFFDKITIEHLLEKSKEGLCDVKVKEINDYWKEDVDDTIDYVCIPIQSSQTLMNSDTLSNYFTENNNDFIEDSGFAKEFQKNNEFLKPTMTLQTKYDVCMGSKNTVTPLRYHTEYRRFLCVNSGKIHVKMTPWKSSKYLYQIRDFENYEFRSPINVWKPQKKYLNEMDKIKFLEFDVRSGYVLNIPSFWWYSIKYSEEPDTLVCGFTYNSIMNCVTNLPNWGLYFLQQHNIKKRLTKTLNIENNENETTENIVDVDLHRTEEIS